jgi:predicted RNA-binding protein with TRAM domain
MTRQNVTDGPREILTVACPTCLGDGIVISHETHAIQAERRLRALTRETRHQAYRVELNAHVGSLLVGAGGARLGEIEEETGRRFFLELRDDVPADHFEVLERGPVSKIAPSSLPVEKGEELEVKLAVRHEHRPADAVARLNGYVVNVAGGAGRLGKTVKVRVQRVGAQSAYAVLVDVPELEPPVDPETALEAEASEDGAAPKRRSRRGGRGRGGRKAAEAGPPADAVGAEEEPAEPDAAPEEPAVVEGVEPEPGQPRRKRRRGSRGGRGRKKKAAEPGMSAEATEQPGEAEASPEATGLAAAAAPDSDSEPKPSKKTRRGSRGGRNRRRRRPAEAAAESAGTPEEEPVTFIAPAEESG